MFLASLVYIRQRTAVAGPSEGARSFLEFSIGLPGQLPPQLKVRDKSREGCSDQISPTWLLLLSQRWDLAWATVVAGTVLTCQVSWTPASGCVLGTNNCGTQRTCATTQARRLVAQGIIKRITQIGEILTTGRARLPPGDAQERKFAVIVQCLA